MNLDRDLREALAPLAGDPVADAARVLASLPPPGPMPGKPAGPLPPIAWWLLLAGLAVGAVAGALVGRFVLAPTATVAPAVPPPAKDAPGPEPANDKDKANDRAKGQMPSPAERDVFHIAAFGDLAIDEPGQGFQDIRAGSWWVKLGTSVMTRDGQAGILVVANDVRSRLDTRTHVTFGESEYALQSGRLWVDTLNRPTGVRVDAGIAAVMLEGGTVMVERQPSGVAVTAIAGNVLARNKRGETARLDPGQQVWIDPERGMTSIRSVPFLPTATSWMTEMITLETDDTELKQRIQTVVAGYEAGAHRELAEREIRKLGSRCTPLLVYSAMQSAKQDLDYARGAAALAAALAEHRNLGYLFELAEGADAELRLAGVRGIVRLGGNDGGHDEAFWRTADAAAREQALAAWRAQLLR